MALNPPLSWKRYLRSMLTIFVCAIVGLALFIASMNPFGNLPNSVLRQHVMTDDNQRYQYPSVVRSGRYDSVIIGTSTSRLLDPRPFETALGGRFANIAMNSGTPWEQTELTKLFLRHQPKPHALVVGIDIGWCSRNADRERITFRGFPEWMYDEDPWNDLAYMLNTRALEIAGRRAAVAMGLGKERLPPDGWEIFTPPESQYDLVKVREKIYGVGARQLPVPQVPAARASADERARWRFPALAWLDELTKPGRWQQVLILLPPVHVTAQPQPGSMSDLEQSECKARIASLAAARRILAIDFRVWSDITQRDENYWDPLHYRVPIAERIAKGVATALATGRDDPAGDWKILNPRE